MKWKKVPEELEELLERSVEPFKCHKRKMFGCPAYFVNDNMFTGAHQDNIFLRLPEPDRKQLSETYDDSVPFEPMKGRVMKEYMVIPEDIYSDVDAFDDWLKRSYEYASKLPPKKRSKRSR